MVKTLQNMVLSNMVNWMAVKLLNVVVASWSETVKDLMLPNTLIKRNITYSGSKTSTLSNSPLLLLVANSLLITQQLPRIQEMESTSGHTTTHESSLKLKLIT